MLSFGAESFIFQLLTRNMKIMTSRTINLPIVLYGCEIWLLILREEHRLKLFENRVVEENIGSKRDEVTAEWR